MKIILKVMVLVYDENNKDNNGNDDGREGQHQSYVKLIFSPEMWLITKLITNTRLSLTLIKMSERKNKIQSEKQ